MDKLVVVLSGGLDSAVALAMRLETMHPDREVHAITFRYGQTHEVELKHAEKIAEHYLVERHSIIDIRSMVQKAFKKGRLIGKDAKSFPSWIPDTYVPARNFIFLSLAAAYAISNDIQEIVCGIHATDAPYPDCKQEALEPFINALYHGTSNNISLSVPLLDLSKTKVVQIGSSLHVPFEKTWSCYFPKEGRPCKECDSCKIRMKAFKEVGVIDYAYGKS